MDYEKLARSRLPIPPLSEQTAIARYLDHVDRRVQRYIGAKRKLVKLLEEQKQAIIQQAVTGQIDIRTTELEEQLDSMKQDIREGVDALTESHGGAGVRIRRPRRRRAQPGLRVRGHGCTRDPPRILLAARGPQVHRARDLRRCLVPLPSSCPRLLPRKLVLD